MAGPPSAVALFSATVRLRRPCLTFLLPVLLVGLLGCSSAPEPPRIAAASSLRQVLPVLVEAWGEPMEVTYGASGTLQRQVELGAPIDGVVFASPAPVDRLVDGGFAEASTRRVLAGNRLVLASAAAAGLSSWEQLGQLSGDQRFSMGEPGSVPAGAYAEAALRQLGVWGGARDHAVFAADVTGALTLARRGEVAGAVVYATDLRGITDLGPTIPASWDGAPAPKVVAARTRGGSVEAGRFLSFLASEPARALWSDFGFEAAPAPSIQAVPMAASGTDGDPSFPLFLSLKIAALALLLVGPPGIALAWLQARKRYPLRGVVDAVILLPLVLPPSVVGYFLVAVLGSSGPVGGMLEELFSLSLIFSPKGAVVASAVVALPLVVKTAQPAIEAVPVDLEHVGQSLGLGPMQLFFRVTLPSAWRGILAALVLAWARGLGEFGATLMFAGHIPGRTNTMPLEIYAAYQRGDSETALIYVAALTALSLVVVALASRFRVGGTR